MTDQTTRDTALYDHPDYDGHERVLFVKDAASGLQAIICIHNSNLGPAMGGTRMWTYASPSMALADALRLSKGMTYKNALAGLEQGGGKAVILSDPRTEKTEAKLRAYGRAINDLGGRFVTGEDVGMSVTDIDIVHEETAFVRGTSKRGLGDPSPYTALGCLEGIKAALAHKHGNPDLKGRHVAVQGLGNVGYRLAALLHDAGATLTVADINPESLARAEQELGATRVDPAMIHQVNADILAPCALGATLNDETIPAIKAGIVAGSANNQLAEDRHGRQLQERGILYAPDYAINAGGVISIALDCEPDDDSPVRTRVLAIGQTMTTLFERADKDNKPTSIIADLMAEERFMNAHPTARNGGTQKLSA